MTIRVGALFAGIGGLDVGFRKVDASLMFASEIDPAARAVLSARFPGVRLFDDVRVISKFPKIDLLTAGFPCQDISLAGTRLGLQGKRSGLVNEVFRLMEIQKPEVVLLENVLNLLRIEKGAALISILKDFEKLGYSWAYRVLDTRGFGLPQRRQRVVIIASRAPGKAKDVLFDGPGRPDFEDRIADLSPENDYGFYWTEGKRGVGWAINAVPTIKGGSSIGIPSPPAVFSTSNSLAGTIHIEDAEALQGFSRGWTDVEGVEKLGDRWRLVGNAVSVPVSEWLAPRILSSDSAESFVLKEEFPGGGPLPRAAFNVGTTWYKVDASSIASRKKMKPLRLFLKRPLLPLSHKAVTGYLLRARTGDKKFPDGFLEALEEQSRLSRLERLPEFRL